MIKEPLQEEDKKVSRRKEIKIRAEINETETKQKIEKINDTKSLFSENVNRNRKTFSYTYQEKKRGLRPIISEIKKTLKLTPQKYNGSYESTKTIICQ